MVRCFSALHGLHFFHFVGSGQSIHSIQVSVQQHNVLHICIVPHQCGGVNRANRKQFGIDPAKYKFWRFAYIVDLSLHCSFLIEEKELSHLSLKVIVISHIHPVK